MKKILLTLLLLNTFNLFSVEYNTYELEIEHVFNASYQGKNTQTDLANDFHSGADSPSGPMIYFDGNELVIADQAHKDLRTIYLNDDYNFNKIYADSFDRNNLIKGNNVILGYHYDYIVVFSKKNGWDIQSLILLNNSKPGHRRKLKA